MRGAGRVSSRHGARAHPRSRRHGVDDRIRRRGLPAKWPNDARHGIVRACSMLDDIAQAVLAREESCGTCAAATARAATRRASGSTGTSTSCAPRSATRSTARCSIRSIRSSARSSAINEHVDIPQQATRDGRIVYVSNHKSHLDYLVEPLVLDDNGIRPPLIAAGINLFGGPLGLLHRHVTGAIPIRRNTKDPAYLITLKAYVAELLKQHDLFFYPEGRPQLQRRAEAAEDRPAPRGAQRRRAEPGDRADRGRLRPRARGSHPRAPGRRRGGSGRSRASSPRWCATRSATESRAFVTFGAPIPSPAYDPQSRRDVLDARAPRARAIGALYKVLPTAVFAAAMRPSITRRDLEARDRSTHRGAARARTRTSASRAAREAVEEGAPSRSTRAASSSSSAAALPRARPHACCATTRGTIEHLLVPTEHGRRTH